MRDIVTAKWSLRPQRLVLGMVLIGMLLLTPQQCLGDDEPVTPTDSSQSQPAQQSPPGGPAPGSSATTNSPASIKNDEGRLAGVRSARVDYKDQGSCYDCDDENTYSPCFDPDKPASLTPCGPEFDMKNVTCYAWSIIDAPKKKDKKNPPKMKYKMGCWTKRDKECLAGILNIKNTELYKKGKSGKCVKGKYSELAKECMESCQRGSVSPSECFPGYPNCHQPCQIGTPGCPYCRPGDPGCSILPPSPSTPPEKLGCYGKYSQTYLVDPKRDEYGFFGQDKYSDWTFCTCTGNKCNDYTKGEMAKPVQASSGSILESSGFASMNTYTLFVATVSFLRLP